MQFQTKLVEGKVHMYIPVNVNVGRTASTVRLLSLKSKL